MRLIWKVLREHISISQLAGFVLANIIGLAIILTGLQLYLDLQPVLSDKGGFMKPDYLVLSKPVSTAGSVIGARPSFSEEEIADLRNQEFVAGTGEFCSAQYSVVGRLQVERFGVDLATEMFFESVPESFVDVSSEQWHFEPGDKTIPVIIPRDYLNLYNFGYAPSSNMPTLSEGMIEKVGFDLYLSGNGKREVFRGKIVGFSSRLNTILVPESFMRWSNSMLGTGGKPQPSRLILQVTNPADQRIAAYIQEHHYQIAGDKLDSSKVNWMLRLLVTIVMGIGVIICGLAFYVLVLSIFLLLQRNRQAVTNLLSIGYTAQNIALPYQLIVFSTNLLSALTAMGIMAVIRHIYMRYLVLLSPDYIAGSTATAWTVALCMGVVAAGVNAALILHKIKNERN